MATEAQTNAITREAVRILCARLLAGLPGEAAT
jgi:hypothetical protein